MTDRWSYGFPAVQAFDWYNSSKGKHQSNLNRPHYTGQPLNCNTCNHPCFLIILSVDIWRHLNINEIKWYLWRAVNSKPELRRRAASAPSGPRVVGRPAPTLTEDERLSHKSRPKTSTSPLGTQISGICAILGPSNCAISAEPW